MNRTVISLPPDMHKRLRIIAAERGVSMASLIREAIEEKVATRPRHFHSVGVGDSGRTDISVRIGEEGFHPDPPWPSS
ncbi:MAG TPA: CopG family transcriptional regulator [Dehalococcoidia bacterium]|nr:CopG family transcriptional regulator [Dehalococcoidia bacterium]